MDCYVFSLASCMTESRMGAFWRMPRAFSATATGTATVSDAFAGVERLRFADERSIKENIRTFLEQPSSTLERNAESSAAATGLECVCGRGSSSFTRSRSIFAGRRDHARIGQRNATQRNATAGVLRGHTVKADARARGRWRLCSVRWLEAPCRP